MPKFVLEDVEDCYTYYVTILGISEQLFWYADYAFVLGVVENKIAYDNWYSYMVEREQRQ